MKRDYYYIALILFIILAWWFYGRPDDITVSNFEIKSNTPLKLVPHENLYRDTISLSSPVIVQIN
jgi:hypothetical protein